MSIKGEITGRVVAEAEDKTISASFSVLEFPLYSDRRVKNRDTNEWESDPKGTTKLQVALKFDTRDAWLGKIKKGQVLKVTGSFFEREFDKKDGTKGRSLQTDFVESVEVVFEPTDDSSASTGDGFAPDSADASF